MLPSMFPDFGHPIRDVLEAFSISHVIDDDDPLGPSVVRSSDRAKSLLSGGIPDLQLDVLAFDFHCLNFKINPNSRREALGKRIICVT
jgi:hypothetical protein